MEILRKEAGCLFDVGFFILMHLATVIPLFPPSTGNMNRLKREYGDRVREVKQASFTPLVFATTWGMGREATVFFFIIFITDLLIY